jgi:hypothetical protein
MLLSGRFARPEMKDLIRVALRLAAWCELRTQKKVPDRSPNGRGSPFRPYGKRQTARWRTQGIPHRSFEI